MIIRLNINKCKIMHIGKNNKQHNYTMNSYETGEPIPLEKIRIRKRSRNSIIEKPQIQ